MSFNFIGLVLLTALLYYPITVNPYIKMLIKINVLFSLYELFESIDNIPCFYLLAPIVLFVM